MIALLLFPVTADAKASSMTHSMTPSCTATRRKMRRERSGEDNLMRKLPRQLMQVMWLLTRMHRCKAAVDAVAYCKGDTANQEQEATIFLRRMCATKMNTART